MPNKFNKTKKWGGGVDRGLDLDLSGNLIGWRRVTLGLLGDLDNVFGVSGCAFPCKFVSRNNVVLAALPQNLGSWRGVRGNDRHQRRSRHCASTGNNSAPVLGGSNLLNEGKCSGLSGAVMNGEENEVHDEGV